MFEINPYLNEPLTTSQIKRINAFNRKKQFISKEEYLSRIEKNKKVLDEIWQELMEVIYQIKHTSDRSTLKILRNRERILTNKYCFSNALDETLTNNF